MELIRGRERDFGQEYLVRLSGQERERLESLVRASKSSCAIADEGGQLIPSAGLRLRCLFSSSRIALIFRPPQKNARCLRGVVDHTRSKSPGGDTSARAPTPENDRSLRIPLKKSNSQPRSEFSWPWTGFGEIHSGGYTIFIDRSQRPASSAREAIQHPRPQVRDKFGNFGPDPFPPFSTISAPSGPLVKSRCLSALVETGRTDRVLTRERPQ
jgi:hypothetical protein